MNVLTWDPKLSTRLYRYNKLILLYCFVCFFPVCITSVQGKSEALKFAEERESLKTKLKTDDDSNIQHFTTFSGKVKQNDIGSAEHKKAVHDDHDEDVDDVDDEHASFLITEELSHTESLAAVQDSLDILARDIKTAFSGFFGSGDDDDHHDHDHDYNDGDGHEHNHETAGHVDGHAVHGAFLLNGNNHTHEPDTESTDHQHRHDHVHVEDSHVHGDDDMSAGSQDFGASDAMINLMAGNNERTTRRYFGWLKNRKQTEELDGHDHLLDHSSQDDHEHSSHDHHEHSHSSHDHHDHSHDSAGDDEDGHDHSHEGHNHGKGRPVSELSISVWLVSSASVLIISLIGVLSVGFLPLLSHKRGEAILQGFICVAVGTLIGDSFIHLAPHALMNTHSSESTWKGFLASMVVMAFIALDKILSFIGVGHSHSHPGTTFTPILKSEQDKLSTGQDHGFEDSFSQSSTVIADDCGSISTASILQDGSSERGEGHSHGRGSNTNLMVIIGDAIHNFADGIAIGAAFSIGYGPGISTSIAVLCHELPHEVGDFAILIQNGMTIKTALMYNLVSSVTGFLGMCLGLVLGSNGEYSTWMIAGIMGVFLYVALVSMLPEIHADSRFALCINMAGMIIGVLLLLIIGLYEDTLVDFLAF